MSDNILRRMPLISSNLNIDQERMLSLSYDDKLNYTTRFLIVQFFTSVEEYFEKFFREKNSYKQIMKTSICIELIHGNY